MFNAGVSKMEMPDIVGALLTFVKYLLLGMTVLLSLSVIVILLKSPPKDRDEEEFPELWWFKKK
ncbi:MAG: hypothetical protein O2964_09530 [Verrucomicrobia bacterium]|nr:hypothetical protein [Verrucomicrobiota bacterium]